MMQRVNPSATRPVASVTPLGLGRPLRAHAARPAIARAALGSGSPSPRPVGLVRGSPRVSPLASSAGAPPPPPSPPAAGGGGGGGGGPDDESEKPSQVLWKGWADRVAADPEFTYKVAVEQVIGVGAAVVGDMSSRPNWGLGELDFVFATLVVGSIVNFALMYLLAPVASSAGATGAAAGAAASRSIVTRLLSDEFLIKWGAPGGHLFEPGFPLALRAVNFAYKGAVFGAIGLLAGLVGTSLSNGLITLRKKLDPTFESPNEPPSVLGNASCWAIQMGFSSNLRYQILNGADMLIQPLLPAGAFRIFTSAVRGGNNIIGGISFVMIAKALGVQKSADAGPVEKAEKALDKAKEL